jgi:pimeloyl-ACP methyl ester carboxylesterase
VVCVPGGPGLDPEAYFAAFELPGHELLVFAPRGTGRSNRPSSSEGYRMACYVDDVESLRIHLGLEALTLYGNSHGGMAVLAYACAHPQRVARFVVSNATARLGVGYEDAVTQARRRFAQAIPDGADRLAASDEADAEPKVESGDEKRRDAFRASMACCVAHEGPAETAYLDRLCSAPTNEEAVAAMYAELREGLDLLDGADLVTAVALVIAAEFDVVVPPAAVRPIADALPNARYVEFPGAGHFLGVVEASQQFRATVCDFLDD